MPRNKSEDQLAQAESQKAWAELVQSCPLLFRGKDRFGFECNPGWRAIIAKLCLEIEKLITAIPEEDRFDEPQWGGEFLYGVAQIKEKYGTLRFYMHRELEGADDLIDAAEAETAKTCEVCGKPGELRNTSWISTLCDDHYGRDPEE